MTNSEIPGTVVSLPNEAIDDITQAMRSLIADAFTLFVKAKNFHWHVSGPHFRDYHLLFDSQAVQILAMVDPMAERIRKIGSTAIHSVGEIDRLRQVADNDTERMTPAAMLAELCADNAALAERMRQTHSLCDEHGDLASAGLLETWIDETEQRVWFLAATGREARCPPSPEA